MWNGKNKAVTFSFDDGVKQDIGAVEILNRYGLKSTFHLNSANFGTKNTLHWEGRVINRDKIEASDVRSLYEGHEVASHTKNHPDLTTISDEEIVYQVEEDRARLSELCGYEIVGLAYPNGACDERVIKVLREQTGIRYARTVRDNFSFDKQENLLDFSPTVHFIDERLEETVERFLALETDKPQLLYIWGHTYALDSIYMSWERFERVCQRLSGKKEIFYGTNKEVLL